MELRFAAKFKRGYERAKKRGKDISKLELTLEALVRGEALPEAVRKAKEYVTGAIEHALPLGHGCGPTHHFFAFYEADCD